MTRAFTRAASAVAAGFAHPAAIVGFPLACVAWLSVGGEMLVFNVALSVLSITTTQLVLYVGGRRDTAMHAKLDELVRAIPQADNQLIGIEGKP